jgi:predicted MPP superfamily phosphohydrolase
VFFEKEFTMKKTRIIIASDIHLCHTDWYGVPTAERMERLIKHLNDEYDRDPYETILFLGDYSLDHWNHGDVPGSYLTGTCNTKNFMEKYASRLKVPYSIFIAGNHEMYGHETWKEITGFGRRGSVVVGDYLFVVDDTFDTNLDPTCDIDAVYTPLNIEFIRGEMDKYPDKKVLLCAHHLAFNMENPEAHDLVLDDRVICMFSGHVHRSSVYTMPDDWNNKLLFRTGNYSYSKENPPMISMWGFRDVYLSDDEVTSRYIVPENTIIYKGEEITIPYGTQDEGTVKVK